jgi:hypothetical protein
MYFSAYKNKRKNAEMKKIAGTVGTNCVENAISTGKKERIIADIKPTFLLNRNFPIKYVRTIVPREQKRGYILAVNLLVPKRKKDRATGNVIIDLIAFILPPNIG